MLASLAAVGAFCLCASSVYVLNDLLDIEADRTHPRKCKRPFAAGELPLSAGVVIAPSLLILAFGLGVFLSVSFITVLAGYYTLTAAYSLSMKCQARRQDCAIVGSFAPQGPLANSSSAS